MNKQRNGVPFGEWLSDVLVERGMKPADLARGTGMDSAVISNILNGRRHPAVESCKLIAAALNMPLEVVYRAAGYLPEAPDVDPITDTVVHLMLDMDHDDRQEILDYVQLRHKRRKNAAKRDDNNTGRGKRGQGKAARQQPT